MAVVAIEFYDFRKIVINCIKFKILFPAPFDSFRQSFAGTAGPENEFVAVAFPFLEIFNQCMVGLTKLRPFAVTQGTVKINSDGLEIQLFLIVHSAHLYEIWREEKLETFTVDFTKGIPIEVFEKWYENQIMYQKVGKMPTITDLQADFIPLHEAAALLGITKEKMSVITRASRFKDCFEIQVFEDKKWISKKSFQHFLNAQSVYQVVKEPGPVKQNNQESMETKEYISQSEAAALAGVTSGTITKWMQMERFSCVGAGKVLRINRKEFLQWLKEYQEGAG